MDKNNRLKIIDLLYNECVSAGGDGDAMWYLIHTKIEDVLPLIEDYNSKLAFPFKITNKTDRIEWGTNQEWIIVTNSDSLYYACRAFDFVIKSW